MVIVERRHTPGALANRKGFDITRQYTMRAGDTGIWNTKPAGRPVGALNSKSSTITPKQIKNARMAAGLTQTEAGKLVSTTLSGWQRWEYGEREIHPAKWELFLSKTKPLVVRATDSKINQ